MYACLITAVVVHDDTSSNTLAIELGVGGGVALLVAIVLCAVGIAYYRRFIINCVLVENITEIKLIPVIFSSCKDICYTIQGMNF